MALKIRKNNSFKELPSVDFSDSGNSRYLHLGSPWIQGSMNLDKPYDIDLEYVQRMMAWLLFVPPSEVKNLHAMQLGLGAASLTKFCRKKLQMKTTVLEINPQVLHACRTWFKLPADDEKLNVIITDAIAEIKNQKWYATVDALQVDLYDDEAKAPVIDTIEFYQDCQKLLTETGTMTVNLFGRSSRCDESIEKIKVAFGAKNVWCFKPTREGNTVIMAHQQVQTKSANELLAASEWVTAYSGLPAKKWLKVLEAPSKKE
jgi:spermidine synthase